MLRLEARVLSVAGLLLLLLLAGPGQARGADAPHVLRVAVNGFYPPFGFTDDGGRLCGFDADFARALCRAMQRECAIRPMHFNAILAAFRRGEVDMAVAGMGASESRRQVVDFTDKYYRSVSIYIARSSDVPAISARGLRGLVLCAMDGTLQEKYLRRRFGNDSTVLSVKSGADVFRTVTEGTARVGLVDGLLGYHLLKLKEGEGLEAFGELVNVDDGDAVARVAVTKQIPGLLQEINRAIREVRRSGEYSAINRKYFDFDIY